jgi:DNA-binding NarL/FixJ family response regulator
VQPVRVFIVDDQEPFRLAAAAVVEATEGFVVTGGAESGEQCLDVLLGAGGTDAARAEVDLVLMDLNLPGIDGLECTRRLRAAGHEAVVFVVSTYDEDDMSDEAREAGAATYVAKSAFDPDRLDSEWARASTGSSGVPSSSSAS